MVMYIQFTIVHTLEDVKWIFRLPENKKYYCSYSSPVIKCPTEINSAI